MSSKAHQPQSPLKKTHKKSSQAEHDDQMQKKNQYSMSKSPFMTQGQKINFQSEDSQGSDISYESSIESEDDINIGQIQYFKEQMGRFFINYPELINHDILDYRDGLENTENAQNLLNGISDSNKSQKLNKNWSLISDQILIEAKDSCSFLESLSHRIALYRSKVYQQDLIDVLLKQQKNIMKQIELQINLKKKQSKGAKNTMMQLTEGSENVYFSWRKKKQIENKLNLHRQEGQGQRNHPPRSGSSHVKVSPKALQSNKSTFRDRVNTLSNNKGFTNSKSQNKKQLQNSSPKTNTFFLTTNENSGIDLSFSKKASKTTKQQKADNKTMLSPQGSSVSRRLNSYSKASKPIKQNQRNRTIIEQGEKQNKSVPNNGGQTQSFWRHLVNFQPRTEAGRQLCEMIKKTNNPNDELGIKKTIMQFLVKNKQTVQNQIVLKSTISQKIQKLYNDDSKQLLMFYPTKMTLGNPSNLNKQDLQNNERPSGLIGAGMNMGDFDSNGEGVKSAIFQGQNSENGMDLGNKLFSEGEKFMHLLEDIVQGPLMKYWLMLQQNKL